jgi:hypothetical protein
VTEDSLEYLVDLETWDSSVLQESQGLLECLDSKDLRVSASKEREEMMVRKYAIKLWDINMNTGLRL